MIILGIETSCDETAAAVVNDKKEILSNIVLSQWDEHQIHGGVVPEIAARAHVEHLDSLIKKAMQDANLDFNALDGVAATAGPGLIGGVLVGMMSAKAIASAKNIPFLAINHLEGHALTPRLTDNLEFPYMVLLISGGHTQILIARGVSDFQRIGTTIDDAAGECFDKSAKSMGLPYPGGPEIEKIAQECLDPKGALERFSLPHPMKGRKSPDFSFSGLKTAIRTQIEHLCNTYETSKTEETAEATETAEISKTLENTSENTEDRIYLKREDIAALAYSFQQKMADILKERLEKAMDCYNKVNMPLVVCGGVAANQAIRASLEKLCEERKIKLFAPPLSLCSDNAAMIAWAGIEKLRLGMSDPLDFKAKPRWPLDPEAAPRQGAGVKA